ncbi:MAG TPA: hypothetical protein VNF24_09835 [Candidatus Acidoferrales bacterium]|nr:hypothetical protein [Candidatus Acidoferrales bacterium]
MKLPLKTRDLPTRLATGAYILNAGLGKWTADEERAKGLHGMASGAFPVLRRIPPARFGKLLAGGEIATGAALLTPLVPGWLAGGALTLFSGALVTMYLRTPGMHQPGSVRPTPQGTAVSKDVWMLGIGLGLLLEAASDRQYG